MIYSIYQTYVQKLLDSGLAYYCFDSKEELDQEREEAKELGIPYKYSRRALSLNKEEVSANLESGMPYTIRFKMPDEGTLSYDDMIRGTVTFDLSLISDFVIMKSDGSPSFNFAVVIDDMLMKISHVIRGEDHISNMPRQLVLFDALKCSYPQFAHLPMILGSDKSKLSKRHGATNVLEYRDQGIMPDTLFNFLSLLGWSPDSEQEIFTREEIIKQFSLDRVSKSGAVFDYTKLTWMNGQYIRSLSKDSLFDLVSPYMESVLKSKLSMYSEIKQKEAVSSVCDNLDYLADINRYMHVYVAEEEQYQENLNDILFSDSDRLVIQTFYDGLSALSDDVTVGHVDVLLEMVLSETGFGKGKVFKPIRLAVSAEKSGPHISSLISILGKEKVLRRLSYFVGTVT